MSVKLADTLAPMGAFEVADAKDISVEIDGNKKMLQTAIDNGEIGGGGSEVWQGTRAEFDALDKSTLKDKQEVIIKDDSNKSLINDDEATADNVWSAKKVSDSLGDLIKSNMKGSEGYLELPNKLCLEWGSNTIASGGTMVEVSLKKLTSCINVQITCFSYAGAHSSFYGWSDSTVKNGFRIYQKDAVTQPRIYKWLAIGTCD